MPRQSVKGEVAGTPIFKVVKNGSQLAKFHLDVGSETIQCIAWNEMAEVVRDSVREGQKIKLWGFNKKGEGLFDEDEFVVKEVNLPGSRKKRASLLSRMYIEAGGREAFYEQRRRHEEEIAKQGHVKVWLEKVEGKVWSYYTIRKEEAVLTESGWRPKTEVTEGGSELQEVQALPSGYTRDLVRKVQSPKP